LNKDAVLGSFNLCQGQPGYWMVKYTIKLRYNWVDPQSAGSVQMVFSSLDVMPAFVKKGVERLSPKHGGEPFWATPEDAENTFTWMLLIGD
jgi:hypothetical protein